MLSRSLAWSILDISTGVYFHVVHGFLARSIMTVHVCILLCACLQLLTRVMRPSY